jgi:hypothetical protein
MKIAKLIFEVFIFAKFTCKYYKWHVYGMRGNKKLNTKFYDIWVVTPTVRRAFVGVKKISRDKHCSSLFCSGVVGEEKKFLGIVIKLVSFIADDEAK